MITVWLLIPFASIGQDSLQSVHSTSNDTIHYSSVINNVSSKKLPQPKQKKIKSNINGNSTVALDSLLLQSNKMFSIVDIIMGDISKIEKNTSILDNTNKEEWNALQSVLDNMLLYLKLILTTLVILVILSSVVILVCLKRKKQTCCDQQYAESQERINEHNNANNIVVLNENQSQPSERDIVAYNDAVQAFVNINNYIYELKRYNALITPYILWFTSDNSEQPSVDISSVPEEERSKIALLVSKIDQFKKNHMQAINRYLVISNKGKTYTDCSRCPINGHFNPELDQHLLGEDLESGNIIHSVYKIGFLFPDSKSYPYREKSLII